MSAPLFISYSRRDFYFAESLSFHLAQAGIPNWLDANRLTPGSDWNAELERAVSAAQIVLVVLTPQSAHSAYVRQEWERARQDGDRIILLRFRSCRPPPELAKAELIDFRGAFGPALQRLLHSLGQERPQAATASSWLPLPPWVVVVTVMLALLFLVPLFSFPDWSGLDRADEPLLDRILFWVLLPFFLWLVVWHTCVAFLRRHMGMTRLALTIAFFTGDWIFFLLVRQGLLRGVVSESANFRLVPVPILWALIALGVSALGFVVLLRPEDLLRWCPTGKAWDAYRRGRVAKVPGVAARFAETHPFHLLHDSEDAPAAERLRSALLSAGAQEAPVGAENASRVLLLTNRTTTAWLSAQATTLEKGLVTVVGSALGLPESLHWLWRRQWIDFRHWNAHGKSSAETPAVPEGMSLLRLPRPVRVAEHLLCALAALLLVCANVAFPPSSSEQETLSLREVLGVILAGVCVGWGVAAWRLVHRTVTKPRFALWVKILTVGTFLFAPIVFPLYVSLGKSPWRALLAAALGGAIFVLLLRQQPRLAFWFPLKPEPGMKHVSRLRPRRKWEPLLWIFVYALPWMWLLALSD